MLLLIKRRFIFFMSRLNFAPLTDAFFLGSEQIRNTQEEINKLRKIISDGNHSKKQENNEKQQQQINIQPPPPQISLPPQQKTISMFSQQNENKLIIDDTDIIKVIHHPKFDEIVKNYIIVKHPEWLNKESGVKTFLKEGFGRSSYGTETKNYIIFFLVSFLLYTLLKKHFKN